MKNSRKVSFGFSKKRDGQMILKDNVDSFLNREIFFNKKGIDLQNVVSTKLDHGSKVKVVTKKDGGKVINLVDGLITVDKRTCLTVTISDCAPILFYDYKNGVIGITHAGWKGALKNIASVIIDKMNKKFNSEFENIEIYIGPHIKKCHFEIRDNVIDQFKEYKKHILNKDNKIFVDLEGIIIEQLLGAGVIRKNISVSRDCTYCNSNYFSFRRDNFGKVVSQIAYIMLK